MSWRMRLVAFPIVLLLASVVAVFAQGQGNGTMTGTVVDKDGVIPGAAVTITERATGAVRTSTSNETGVFRFPGLPPGRYDLRIEMASFKPVVVEDAQLVSNETRDLGNLMVQPGGLAETLTVTAEVTPVQVASSSRQANVTGDTLTTVQVKGRDVFGLLKIVPGVQDLAQDRGFTSWQSGHNVTINGAPAISKNVLIDGMSVVDEGGCGTAFVNPNIDAIGEVNVIANGFTAENGRNAGGLISIVTKSGTSKFKGSGWYNGRRDRFNANDYFRKINNQPKPFYRVNISGFGVGGPVIIPKLMDSRRSEKKAFFFVSEEYTNDARPTQTSRVNLPTELERRGDFSQSFYGNATATQNADGSYTITGARTLNTLVNPKPAEWPDFFIANNVINPKYFSPLGMQLLDLLQKPNGVLDLQAGQGWASNDARDQTPLHVRTDLVTRFDFVLSPGLRTSVRYLRDTDDSATFNAFSQGVGTLVQKTPGQILSGSVIQVLKPTLVNEINVGYGFNRAGQLAGTGHGFDGSSNAGAYDYSQWYQDTLGIHPPRFQPFGDYGDPHIRLLQEDQYPYIPVVSFAGGNRSGLSVFSLNGANTGQVLPRLNINRRSSFQDDLSWTSGRHNFKFGFYTEYNQKTDPGSQGYLGNFTFGSANTNPLDTGNGYANALVGIYTTYTEASRRIDPMRVHWQTDGYAQDNWRVGNRITLDYGVRLTHSGPIHEIRHENTGFDPTLWDASKAGRLYYPICGTPVAGNQSCPSNQRFAYDPQNPGALISQAFVGQLIPGTGIVNNGVIVDGYPGFGEGTYYRMPRLFAAPRLGVAWNVTGDGKTAIRASTGIFFNFPRGQWVWSGGVPVIVTRTLRNAEFADISTAATTGTELPQSPSAYSVANPANMTAARSYNVNVAFQREIGFSTTVELSYVGNFGRNGQRQKTVNNIPLYAFADPNNQFNGTAVSADFLRQPYPGMGNLQVLTANEVTLDYNALQLSVQRRLSQGLQMGLAYTRSKAMGIGGWDYYTELLYGEQGLRDRYYGPTAEDRPHNLVINYSYALPNPTPHIPVARQALGNWEVSGIVQYLSGGPVNPTCGTNNTGIANTDPTYTGVTVRCQLTGEPIDEFTVDSSLPFYAQPHFNLAAFTRPQPLSATVGNFGDAPFNLLRNPGWWNVDLTLARRVPVKLGRTGNLRIQVQAYNVFNLVQFKNMDATYLFTGPNNSVNTTTTTGQYTTTPTINGLTPPRSVGLTLRLDY